MPSTLSATPEKTALATRIQVLRTLRSFVHSDRIVFLLGITARSFMRPGFRTR